MSNPIYCTGIGENGKPLLGGIWRMYSEQGFPIEMSHMEAQEKGCQVDWLEAMADASLTADCPRLVQEMEQFLSGSMHEIKTKFVQAVRKFSEHGNINDDVQTYRNILTHKRQNAIPL